MHMCSGVQHLIQQPDVCSVVLDSHQTFMSFILPYDIISIASVGFDANLLINLMQL